MCGLGDVREGERERQRKTERESEIEQESGVNGVEIGDNGK